MSFFELLFGFQGRISRGQWWLGQLSAMGMAAIFYTIWSGWVARYGLTSDIVGDSRAAQIKFLTSMLIVGTIISSTLVWILFSLAIKRVHDREHSGWWALAFGLPFMFAMLMPNFATKAFAAFAVLWYFLELGGLRGSPFHNAYGPPPVRDDAEENPDPLDLSVAENIERALAASKAGRTSRVFTGPVTGEFGQAALAGDGSATSFGRRASN